MFALWYSVLSWKVYRDVIYEKLDSNSKFRITKSDTNNTVKEKSLPNVPVPSIPAVKPASTPIPTPKSIPIIPKEQQTKLPTPVKPTTPQQLTTTLTDNTTRKDDKSTKLPIRSPSPHPLRNDDIEYDERFSDEEDDDDDDEDHEENDNDDDDDEDDEDDEDSVIDKEHWVIDNDKTTNKTNTSKDFLKQEIQNQQNNTNILRKTDTMVDAAVLEKLEAGFKKLEASDSKSLLKKYLTREIFDNLKTKKTSFGSTLLDVIQSGLENHDSGVGIYAPDAESYTVFADLFDPIIEDYHSGFKKTDKHPPKNWGDVNTFGNLDPAGDCVISTRVRCGRSMEGYPFNPCLTEEQYKEMEQKVSTTLSGLEGELKGTFYPLTGMSKDVQQKLIDDHFLFKEGDRFLQAANACRFWPSGRGIYHNDAKTFLVWCNEEDHLRIISMQMGGDLGQVFRRLVSAVNDIEKRVPFSHNDRLGFLTFCPTNLGTTVRASVHIKVPKLASNKAKLEEVAAKYNLQVRGTRGEHTEAEGGVYDISNKRRMGLTEYDAVKEMYDGIAEIIKMEKEL